jgi:hypothetical protein
MGITAVSSAIYPKTLFLAVTVSLVFSKFTVSKGTGLIIALCITTLGFGEKMH